jgi:NAD(P)-dependent dehydrogenase (short-subunit alcohol dehydrogenase family)
MMVRFAFFRILTHKRRMKSIVVTGVSSGIGFAVAKFFIERQFRVFGSVRRQTDADRLAQELGGNFTPLIFDTTDEPAVRHAADKVKNELAGAPLFGLVANAGIAVAGPLLYVKPDDFRRQLEVNLTGTLLTVQAFAPLLIGKPPGRIVLISSVAGKTALPFNGPYSISKFGTEAFAEALRRELMIFGIDVITIAPGPIQSAIWEKTTAIDTAPLAETAYAQAVEKTLTLMRNAADDALPAEKLAGVIHRALTAKRPKHRYVVTPDALGYYALRLLPKRLADKIIAAKLGLRP